jgi:carbamoyl-phosphate synthase small subunit
VTGADKQAAGLLGKVPLMGICLGHQVLSLAMGGKTYKLKFGHRGANHPVREMVHGHIDLTSQNHGFSTDEASIRGKAVVTHVNLNDGTVEGIASPEARMFAVQYHPEDSPGPHDSRYLFRRFAQMIEDASGAAAAPEKAR